MFDILMRAGKHVEILGLEHDRVRLKHSRRLRDAFRVRRLGIG